MAEEVKNDYFFPLTILVAAGLVLKKFVDTTPPEELREGLYVLGALALTPLVILLAVFVVRRVRARRRERVHELTKDEFEQRLSEACARSYKTEHDVTDARDTLNLLAQFYPRQAAQSQERIKELRRFVELQAEKLEQRAAEERRAREAQAAALQTQPLREFHITLDPKRGLYRAATLSPEEENYLKLFKYEAGTFVPVGALRQERFLIEKNGVESLAHTFLVYSVRDELEKYVKHIKIAITNKPDLTFTDKHGREWAVEIETGLNFKKRKRTLDAKFAPLIRHYKTRLIVILTSSAYRRHYKKLLPKTTILVRTQVTEYFSRRLA